MSNGKTEDLEQILESEVAEGASMPDQAEDYSAMLAQMSAKEAIDYIKGLDNVDAVYAVGSAEEKGKARTTVLGAVGPQVQKINEAAAAKQAEAAPPAEPEVQPSENTLPTPSLSEPDPEAPPNEAGSQDGTPYPIEQEWEGELGRYQAIKHISRTMNPMGGLDSRVISPAKANEYLEDHFAKGYELIKVIPQGFGQDGVSILWVLGLVQEGEIPAHSEIWHIQRVLTEHPMQSGGVTGFQADTYVSSFLKEGWKLFTAEALQSGGTDIPMLWVLVR